MTAGIRRSPSSEIEGGEPVDASARCGDFRLDDGGELREQLLALSDADRRLQLLPARGAAAAHGLCRPLRLRPVTDGDADLLGVASEFAAAALAATNWSALVARRHLSRGVRGHPPRLAPRERRPGRREPSPPAAARPLSASAPAARVGAGRAADARDRRRALRRARGSGAARGGLPPPGPARC